MESDVQRAVCEYLSRAGIPWARNNTGRRGNVSFGLRIPSLERSIETRGGGPDLFVAPTGVRVVVVRSVREAREALEGQEAPMFMELKDAGEDLRPSQLAWMKFMQERRR